MEVRLCYPGKLIFFYACWFTLAHPCPKAVHIDPSVLHYATFLSPLSHLLLFPLLLPLFSYTVFLSLFFSLNLYLCSPIRGKGLYIGIFIFRCNICGLIYILKGLLCYYSSSWACSLAFGKQVWRRANEEEYCRYGEEELAPRRRRTVGGAACRGQAS